MRITILFFILNLPLCILVAGNITSKVDERIELTGIVFRLAGAEEYVNEEITPYSNAIDAYFEKYKTHPLISYARETLRLRDSVAYGGITGSALLLQIKEGKISLNPEVDLPLFLDDPRWSEETLKKYIILLNDFYAKTKFRVFFNGQKELYARAEANMNKILDTIHTDWFHSFYGQPLGNPTVYVCLTNGRHNYAFLSFDEEQQNDSGIAIGCTYMDENGFPTFNEDIIPVIVHEYAHLFTNPLISRYSSEMSAAANRIFPYVKDELTAAAYGEAMIMLIEGFNNLFTCMYFREHPTGFEKHKIAELESRGFIWLKRNVSFMDHFYANRDLYPTIEDFMPQLISFFNFTADNIKEIKEEYERKNPYVVNVYPALNSVVDPGITSLRVEFSHPMWEAMGVYSIDEKNLEAPFAQNDLTIMDYWSPDRKTIIMPVQLKANTRYGFLLPAGVYQSEDTYPMKENFEIRFSTK